MSLAWPTLVQLVVSFNSGLQWRLAKSTLSLFRHNDRFDFVFSLRCFDEVRKPLSEPIFFFCPFSILITLLGEEGAGLCAYRAFVY